MQSPNEPKDVMKPSPSRGVYPRLEPVPPGYGGYGHTIEADSGSFVQYFRILRRRKAVLALTAGLGAIVAFLFTLPQTPVYRAQTLLEVENLNEDFLNMRNASPTVNTPVAQGPEYNIRTYTTVLQSRPVLERAVHDLKLDDRIVGDSSAPAGGGLRWRTALGLREKQPIPPREQALMDLANALKV